MKLPRETEFLGDVPLQRLGRGSEIIAGEVDHPQLRNGKLLIKGGRERR